ncbi:hypothetical protein AWH62_13795 [Maricaulis sp. W15]|uniref:hypothetical protein n=1 Tax=Maricaulis sp. W15 TaxID=1772333 RepID=UPI0009655028|nr:hypothetical protein [Maricaulis sp. W15]OLF80790.1 hypothetical protein AWH62_13795 [Maricaulis sp. W15]
MLQTALDFGLVSRLTSLVAVDVTPARPEDTPLASQDVPAMIPDGWDFGAVAQRPAANQLQALLNRSRLDVRAAPAAGGEAERSSGLALPATATPREILMGLGALMMILALIWLVTRREERLW